MMNRRSKAKTAFGYGIFSETNDSAVDKTAEETADAAPPSPPPSSRERPDHKDRGRTDFADTRFGPVGKKGEPLCLAEILAIERSRGFVEPDYDATYERFRRSGDATFLSDLEAMSIGDLVAEARKFCVEDASEESPRRDLIFQILRKRIRENGLMFGEGTLEILPDQFGFLRSPEYHYRSSPDDIYISPSQIRRFGLRKGCTVTGQIRPPKENERYFALLRVEAVNREEPGMLHHRPVFEQMTPVYPDTRIELARPGNDADADLKIIDRMTPLGFGQRGLLICPPRSAPMPFLRRIVSAAQANYPELYLFMLLLEEQPEEITETSRSMKNDRCEVVGSFFDEAPAAHIHVADIVLEKAKRMVEYGKDVLVVLDSMTRLARAWNGGPMSSGDDGGAREALNLQSPKKYFGSARKLEEGGSLTILSTFSVQTGNPIDDRIYDVFKGRGNLELRFDPELAEKGIEPPIDFHQSRTQHEEFLLSDQEYHQAAAWRRETADMTPEETVASLKNRR